MNIEREVERKRTKMRRIPTDLEHRIEQYQGIVVDEGIVDINGKPPSFVKVGRLIERFLKYQEDEFRETVKLLAEDSSEFA